LAKLTHGELKNTLTNKVKARLSEEEISEIYRALLRVPVATLKWSMVAVDD
jgi:hypothetical protein